MLNLTYRELATEEDRRYGLDRWADAFLADTWEDFQMLAREDTIFREVADSIYRVLVDENQREALRRYEERKAEEEWIKNAFLKQGMELQKQEAALREKDEALWEKDEALQEKNKRIAELEKALAEAGITQR